MANISYNSDEFSTRHNSISSEDQRAMLDKIGVESLDKLIDLTIPNSIKSNSFMAFVICKKLFKPFCLRSD